MRRVVVMGLGITGRAVATALVGRGVEVVALDDRITDEVRSWARDCGIDVLDPAASNLASVVTDVDALLPAPGLPDHHPIFAAAAAVGIPVMSEFDLASGWDDRPSVAVTGTDGKTTVVTLIERMLERSGIRARAVGNTDTPWVEAIEDEATEVFVVEASSFRLGHSASYSPAVATWLNFGPDHLDAHRSIGAYEQAKASIWSRLDNGALAIANRDDAVVARHAASVTVAAVETFGAGSPPTERDHGVVDGVLVSHGQSILRIDEMARSMPHDVSNALAAAATARRAGARIDAIASVLREFDGLEHRVQVVAEVDGVRFVNDSKATTPHATAAALGAFTSIVLLAGGKNKGLAFDGIVEHSDRLVHVVAIGDAAAEVEAAFAGHVPTSRASSMEDAVDQATRRARPGDVVLLSPACASYDWYRSYVHRGEDFIRIVHGLRAGDTKKVPS